MELNSAVDQLDIYDTGAVKAVEALPFQPDGRAVPVILATPERAFATGDKLRNEDPSQGAVFPVISVERGDLAFDELRFRNPNTLFKRNANHLLSAKQCK